MTVNLFTVHMPPKDVLMPALEDVLYSGYIGQGPKVEAFEKKLSVVLETENVLTVNSGTSALQLAMRLVGLRAGRNNGLAEVITSPMTCTATNMPILAECGLPVWADVDPDTGLIDPQDVERKITPRTMAILAVDWGGTPCNYTELKRIGEQYGLWVIQDAAHAWGSRFKGRAVGTYPGVDYTAFSLQAIKHITTVDGGVLTTSRTDAYQKGKLLRWYGIDREGDRKDFRCEEDIDDWGYKFHMNDVAATIGLCQLDYLQGIVQRQQANARFYKDNLSPIFRSAQPPWLHDEGTESAFWLYTILLPNGPMRLKFMQWMKDRDIQTSQVHARNDKHTFARNFSFRPLPGVSKFVDRMVCIPVHWKLTKEERQHVVDSANSFVAHEMAERNA